MWCERGDLNPHGCPRDPKSRASASSATLARRGALQTGSQSSQQTSATTWRCCYFVPLDASSCQPILLWGTQWIPGSWVRTKFVASAGSSTHRNVASYPPGQYNGLHHTLSSCQCHGTEVHHAYRLPALHPDVDRLGRVYFSRRSLS